MSVALVCLLKNTVKFIFTYSFNNIFKVTQFLSITTNWLYKPQKLHWSLDHSFI
jgi:hypothetical protein